MDILQLSTYNQQAAWEIVKDIKIVSIWENIGATVNLVGSLQTGLLMKNRDIDFHIYTGEIILSESFRAMEQLAQHPCIREIHYKNLLHTEEACIEWHAWYEDESGNLWQLDLIHIRKGSLWDGVVEKVSDAIREKLTPDTRKAILDIKYHLPDDMHVKGFDIYRAVFTHGVRTFHEFLEWYAACPPVDALKWMP